MSITFRRSTRLDIDVGAIIGTQAIASVWVEVSQGVGHAPVGTEVDDCTCIGLLARKVYKKLR
jgi:hypothetical protein